jgi:hypothetical protein
LKQAVQADHQHHHLKDVFERLPTLRQYDLALMLPHNWQPAIDTAAAPNTALAAVAA